jgi:hypothetical protein
MGRAPIRIPRDKTVGSKLSCLAVMDDRMAAFMRPHIGHSGCRYAILKAAIRYLPRPTPAEEKDNGIF